MGVGPYRGTRASRGAGASHQIARGVVDVVGEAVEVAEAVEVVEVVDAVVSNRSFEGKLYSRETQVRYGIVIDTLYGTDLDYMEDP